MRKDEQGLARTAFQIGGQAVGVGVDTVAEMAKKVTPDLIENGAKKLIGTVLRPVRAGIDRAADKLSDTKFFQEAAASSPELPIERDLKATNEYLNLVGPKAAKGLFSTMRAAAPRAANAASKVTEKLTPDIAPFAKSFKPDVAKEFAEEGITPPVSAITNSPFVQAGESLAAKSVFGRKVTEQVQNAAAEIDKRTNAVVDRIKPVKSISDENLGKTIQEGLKEYEDNFKVTENKIYAEFGQQYGLAPSRAMNTYSTLSKIIADQGQDMFKGVDPRLQNMFEKLQEGPADLPKMVADMQKNGMSPEIIDDIIAKLKADTPDRLLTFEELKATRTSVGEQLARDPDNGALKQLYGALSRDMEEAVNYSSDAAEKLSALNASYRNGKQKIESRIAQSIEQSNPERIAQNLITRNSAETLRTLKEMVGETRFQEISKTFLRQQLDAAVTRGRFDVDKLKTGLARYDNETLSEVLTSTQRNELTQAIAQLEKYQRLGQALKPGQKYLEGSQTAFLQNVTGTGARVAAIATALVSGNIAIAVSIIFGTAAEAVYARLFTTPIGRRFLTEGFQAGSKTNSP